MSPVAVIIVNYRSAPFAVRALASLDEERAAHPELELTACVVENCSGDEAALGEAIAARFAHFARLVVSPENGGFGAGNNLGARACRSRYLHFLNPDTEVRPGAVRALARFLDNHPGAAVAGGSFEHADGAPWNIAFRFPGIASEFEAGCHLGAVSRACRPVAREMGDLAEPVDWISGASMMVRRDAFEAAGGFDEGFFLYFEEIDLCRRIGAAGWDCWYVPESRVMHVRGRSTGVTALDRGPQRLPRYWFESRRRYFRKHHGAAYALAADAAFLCGHAAGALKDALKGVPSTPHLLGDFLREAW